MGVAWWNFFVEVGVQERAFDGFADGADGFALAADFLPRELGHGVEKVVVLLGPCDGLQRDAEACIHAHFVARFELLLRDEVAAIHDRGLVADAGADAEAVACE